MKIQHLVLDDDVHKALKARKKKIGLTVKEIGNSALRAALGVPTKEDLVVEKLVASGKITREEYEQAVALAEKEAKALQKKALEAAVPGRAPRTWEVGSWTIEEVYRSPDGELQIGLQSVRNGKKELTPTLVHDQSHVWAVVLAGRVRLVVDGEQRVLEPHDVVHVPPGTPHASAPLVKTTRVVLVVSPAVELPH